MHTSLLSDAALTTAKSKSYIKNIVRPGDRTRKESRKSDVKDSLMKFLDECGDEDLLTDSAFSPTKRTFPLSHSDHMTSPRISSARVEENKTPKRRETKRETRRSSPGTDVTPKTGSGRSLGQSEHGTPSTEKRALSAMHHDRKTRRDEDWGSGSLSGASPTGRSSSSSLNSRGESQSRSKGKDSTERSTSRMPSGRSLVKRSTSDRSHQSVSRGQSRGVHRAKSEGTSRSSTGASRGVHRTRSESTSRSLSGHLAGNDRLSSSHRRRHAGSVSGTHDHDHRSMTDHGGGSDRRSVTQRRRLSSSLSGINDHDYSNKSLSGHLAGSDRVSSSHRRRHGGSVSGGTINGDRHSTSVIVGMSGMDAVGGGGDGNDDSNDDGSSVYSSRSSVSAISCRPGRTMGLDAGPLNALLSATPRRQAMAGASAGFGGSSTKPGRGDMNDEDFLKLRRQRQDEILSQAQKERGANQNSVSDLEGSSNFHEKVHDMEQGDDVDQPMVGGKKLSAFARFKKGISKTGQVTKNTAKGTVNAVRDPKRVAMKVGGFAKDLGKETGKMLLDPKLAAKTAVSLGKDVTMGTLKVTKGVGKGVAKGGLGLTKTVARTGMDATSMVVEGAGKVVTGATGLIFKQSNEDEDKYEDYDASELADRRLGQSSLLDRIAKSQPAAGNDGGKTPTPRIKNHVPTLMVGDGKNNGWDF